MLTIRHYILISLLAVIVLIFTLLLMGRVPWCTCGYIKLWHGVVQSSENSQHIFDWYTFTHIIHGFIFYWIFSKIGKKRGWPLGVVFLLALFTEIGWELLENSNFIINRYREATISLDYYGDSIINSVSDVFSMIAGFFLARRMPVWLTITVAVSLELFVGYYIRDNLTLNVIMLIYPLHAIKVWQSGG